MAKYKAYLEYKDSGVDSFGCIPKQWSVLRLKYIFEIKKRIAGALGFDILSVTQRGIKIKDIDSGEGQLSMDYSKYQRVLPGDFAMNHMDLLTGYVDISNYDGVTSPDYRVFSVRDSNDFYSRYFLYLLQDGYKQRRFFHLGQGSAHLGRWRLPTEAFNEILYPLPSLEEQMQIAAFLDHETAKIDNLIEKQQQLIELLKEKRQAVISHAVTKGLNPDVPMKDSGVEWLGEVPEHWIVSPLKIHVFTRKGVAFKSTDFCDYGVRVIKASDIKQKSIQTSDIFLPEFFTLNYPKAILNSGDIVLSTVGSTPDVKNSAVGQIGLVPPNLNGTLLNQNTVVFSSRPDMLNQLYLFFLIQTNVYRDHLDLHAHGTANQASLNITDMLDFKYACPPLIEQVEISKYIKKYNYSFDLLESKSESAIKLLQERRTALISAAVTGKIDVRDWVAPNACEAEVSQEATA
ncbi:restriction endonuclease subunit S [Hafnia alvei]|uniref:restriction endonuclease subunit S n=1 Tax=Hafnia alvei TaxID=569 RepID=UPI001033BF31|nr:restriction endonuclease subunit S [Hafnia alvei]TBL93669.1 restriction endonuclease subunit S [Hafnia alvei]